VTSVTCAGLVAVVRAGRVTTVVVVAVFVAAVDDLFGVGARRWLRTGVEAVVRDLDPAAPPTTAWMAAGSVSALGVPPVVRASTTIVVAIESPSASQTVVSRSHVRRLRVSRWRLEECRAARGGLASLGRDMDPRSAKSFHAGRILST
jgi:hypothetical protein